MCRPKLSPFALVRVLRDRARNSWSQCESTEIGGGIIPPAQCLSNSMASRTPSGLSSFPGYAHSFVLFDAIEQGDERQAGIASNAETGAGEFLQKSNARASRSNFINLEHRSSRSIEAHTSHLGGRCRYHRISGVNMELISATSTPMSFALSVFVHFWFPLLVIVLLEGIAVYLWQFRAVPGAKVQAYVQGGKGAWLLALVFINLSSGLAARIFWVDAYHMLAILLAFLWYVFIAQLSGFNKKAPAWLVYLLGSVVGVLWLIILTNSFHGWFWSSVALGTSGVWFAKGPAFYLQVVAAYLMNILSVLINVRWALSRAGLRRRHAWLFLLPSVITWMGQILTFLPQFKVIQPEPLCFFLSGVVMTWAFRRWCMYSILPLAQEVAVKTMIDGLMVVDEEDHIVDLNPTAKSIFDGLNISEGNSFHAVAQAWPALAALEAHDDLVVEEAALSQGEGQRFYRVALTPLQTEAGHRLGRVLVFKDITLVKHQQDRIVEQEKALSTIEERARLGRELHDGPGQLCGYLSMQTQAARILMAKHKYEQADLRLEQLQQTVQGMFVGLRESITGLQTGMNGDDDLLNSLREQLLWYQEHCGLHTELDLRCAWQANMLSPGAEVQLLRILQEALANVRKSAHASHVSIVIEMRDEYLVFVVEDDGSGFDMLQKDHETGHHGLRIMSERAEQIDARFSIDSNPGRGTRIELRVPLDREFQILQEK